ncbi:glycosyltransferase [Hymenobacter cheonanensis]|uniref:glycosyltransferase n=1 Tax=Hymenobacter sp. CA2-7 TaxID=3063993 RepID=UPI002712C22A|nr:hypothetical protein [Hymenobacter sp. CA2-7]MDO7884890.1 hypothetical protein [Hymenobacter sp. CA2-7]
MAHVLLVSHTARPTGFGRVAIGIATALAEAGHRVQVLGVGLAQAGDTWAGQAENPFDMACTSALREWVRATPPEAVLLIGVGTLSAWQAARLRRDGYAGPLVAYVPVEGAIHDPSRLAGLLACTEVVAYHAAGAVALAGALGPGCPVSWLYHGVETPAAGLAPLPRPQVRTQLLPGLAAHAAHTWVLNANRHDLRKNPELTLRAFAEVVAAAPATTLLLHGTPQRPGLDLRRERDRLGLRAHVVFTEDELPRPWAEAQLTALYQCCEIGVSSALGEGFGLIAFEHAQQGGAQLLPAHAGLREIWGTAPAWVPVAGARFLDEVFTGQEPDPAAFAAGLLQLVQQPLLARANAAACAARAHHACFSWATVGRHWQALVARLLGAAHRREVGEPAGRPA